MNRYLKNLEKIEFAVTYACTGRCKHCSQGDHPTCGEHINADVAADCVKKIAKLYNIKTVMTFGGEPLLYPDTVYSVMSAAREMNIPKRQVITNGYFSKDTAYIQTIAENLAKCGVNDLLISADAFHQETIPLDTVKEFAKAAKANGIPTRIQPAWLVSASHNNPYNRKTREILAAFEIIGFPISDGNIIFPEGNAPRYLGEYFTADIPKNPYTEDSHNVKCVSFSPNGDVLSGNVYRDGIVEILERYEP